MSFLLGYLGTKPASKTEDENVPPPLPQPNHSATPRNHSATPSKAKSYHYHKAAEPQVLKQGTRVRFGANQIIHEDEDEDGQHKMHRRMATWPPSLQQYNYAKVEEEGGFMPSHSPSPDSRTSLMDYMLFQSTKAGIEKAGGNKDANESELEGVYGDDGFVDYAEANRVWEESTHSACLLHGILTQKEYYCRLEEAVQGNQPMAGNHYPSGDYFLVADDGTKVLMASGKAFLHTKNYSAKTTSLFVQFVIQSGSTSIRGNTNNFESFIDKHFHINKIRNFLQDHVILPKGEVLESLIAEAACNISTEELQEVLRPPAADEDSSPISKMPAIQPLTPAVQPSTVTVAQSELRQRELELEDRRLQLTEREINQEDRRLAIQEMLVGNNQTLTQTAQTLTQTAQTLTRTNQNLSSALIDVTTTTPGGAKSEKKTPVSAKKAVSTRITITNPESPHHGKKGWKTRGWVKFDDEKASVRGIPKTDYEEED